MGKDGLITRKDIIEDQALTIGTDYAKNMQPAIEANKQLVASLKEMAPFVNMLRKVSNQKEYIALKELENLATLKVINALKIQDIEEANAQKRIREKISLEKSELDLANKKETATKRNTKLTIEERVQNEVNNRLLKQEARERLGLVNAYEKLNRARTEAKNKLRDLIAAENKNTGEIIKAQREYDILNKKVIAADHAVDDFTKNVGNYPFQSATTGIKNLIAAFGITTGIALFAGILRGAYNEIKKFEQGIADLSAITGATGKDLVYLKSQAIETGKGVKGGAIAVVEAYKLIASAKPELLENVKDLNLVTDAVLTLSKASGLELPDAATRLTDAMNQFNAPASEATRYIDALANGAKYGAAEIPDITDAMLKFGAVARSTNVSVEESTALIEVLAENGLKGADAGTALRNVLLKLNAPDALPKKAQEALKELGVSFDLLKDKTIPIQQKLEALKPILNNNAALVKVFGLENVVAAQNVIGHTDRLKELTSKMDEYGTAQHQADVITDTLQGDTDKLVSTYDSLILSLNKGSGVVTGFFRFFIDGAKGALDGLIKLNSSVEELGNNSRSKGSSYALKIFNVDKTKEELAKDRDKIAEEMGKTTELINKLQTEFKEKSFLSSFNPFSKGTAVAKREITELYNTLGQYEGAYKKIQAKLNPKKANPITGKTIEATNTQEGETDKEKSAREKPIRDKLAAEKKLNDDLYNLEKQRLERIIQINDDIAKDDSQNDQIRIAASLNMQENQIKLTEISKKYYLDADKFVLDKDKLSSNEKVRIEEDAANKIVDIEKKTADQIKKISEFDTKYYEAGLLKKTSDIEIASDKSIAIENEEYKKILENKLLNDKQLEDAAKKHEENLFNIKLNAAKELAKILIANTELELEAYKQQSDGSEKSNAFILALEKKLYEAKANLSSLGLEKFKNDEDQKIMTAKEKAELTLEISMNVTNELGNLASAFSEAKIQKIDDEINKNNEYYERQIELAGNDERQKDALQKERDKKNEALEKKKRAAQQKQAVFDKAINIAMISMATALAVIKAYTEGDPYTKVARSIIAGVVGSIQLAAAIATPIPKYKMGRKGGPAEVAVVGDGGVPEVVSRPDGSGARITPNKPTLTFLQQDDVVHKSMADFNQYKRNAIIKGFYKEKELAGSFQMINNQNSNPELLEELRRNTEAIKKQKTNVQINNTIDLGHELWKLNNTNWRG